MSEMNQHYQQIVRATFKNAKLKTDGFLYWVESEPFDGEIISAKCSDMLRAWRTARKFVEAR